MKPTAVFLLALFYSTIAVSQNRMVADSLDQVIKTGLRKTVRMDIQTDSSYSSFYFKKENKKVTEAVVTTRETETTYDFSNEQLVRVRLIVLKASGKGFVYGRYHFLNGALIHTEESGMQMANPLELSAQADQVLKLARTRIK